MTTTGADARDDGFRPVRTIEEPVHPLSPWAARSGYRVFAGAGGFEAAITEQLVVRALMIGRGAAPNEWHGYLVGRIFEHDGARHVVVDGIVPDPDARAWPSFVETTAESELRTRNLARQLFPDCVLLGWVHGHVRHGARFSSVDKKTQATWDRPHSLGIVVDPWDPRELAVYRGPDCEQLTEEGSDADRSRHEGAVPSQPTEEIADAAPPTEPPIEPPRSPLVRRILFAAAVAAVIFCLYARVRGEMHLLERRVRNLEGRVTAQDPPRARACGADDAGPTVPVCWPDGRGE